MRAFVSCATALAACTVTTVASNAPPTKALEPVPTKVSILASCRGTGNEVTVRPPGEGDPPIVVLEEERMHGYQPSQPTIAIWADGSVLYSKAHGGGDEELHTVISPETAAEIAHEVFADLEGVARYTNVDEPYIISGGQLTTIVVRAGSRWRTASVYDVYRDGFLGIEPEPALAAGTPDTRNPLSDLKRAPPPARFAEAYRRLVAGLPTGGDRFTAYEFDAVFFGAQRGVGLLSTEVVWPRDLPSPPAQLRPASCDAYETDGCAYVVGPAFRAAAARFKTTLHSDDNRAHAVIANDSRFVVRMDPLYEGERAVDAVTTCARSLWQERGP